METGDLNYVMATSNYPMAGYAGLIEKTLKKPHYG